MAAPSGIKWGSTVGSYGRIGIYTSLSSTSTATTITVQIWFWSKYSVSDTGNTLYYTLASSASSAKDSKGSVSVKTTVASGDGWSTSNQVKLYEYTHSAITRGTSAQTRYLYAKLTDIDRVGGTMEVSTTVSVPKLASYTVSYNANGGSGAPSSQTKYYGKSLTLSSTKPTRTGYTFKGWGTSESDTSVDYAAGASYTNNAAITLYAIWTAKTYTVTYNANGGSGGPSSQTKTHGTALTLSSTKPTRTNYTFKGWGTSASSTTVAYTAGGSYTNNANITLYAIWSLAYAKPKISNLSVTRCDSSGNALEDGTYAKVSFNWSCEQTLSSIQITWQEAGSTSTTSVAVTDTSGTATQICGSGALSADSTYNFTVKVTDSGGYSTATKTLNSQKFPIDAIPGNGGIAFGKSAELEDTADFLYEILARKLMTFLNDVSIYGRDTDGVDYSALIPVTASGNTSLGHGLYKAGKGNTHIYGNYVQFYTKNGIHTNGSEIYLKNNEAIYGAKIDGTPVEALKPRNANGNTVIGYGNYQIASGNTNIYGHDLNFGISNIATPGSYRPYYRKGDTISVEIKTAGYLTNSNKDIYFIVPLSRPVIGSPTVTAASVDGLILRQDDQYTHGSGASTYVKPSAYTEAISSGGNFIQICATRSTTTNSKNNAPIGVHWSGTITFS